MPRYRAPRICDYLSLTEREREVLVAVADGLTDQEIASAMHRSRFTVLMHMKSLRKKLGQSCRAHLVRVAIEAQILVQQIPLSAAPESPYRHPAR